MSRISDKKYMDKQAKTIGHRAMDARIAKKEIHIVALGGGRALVGGR